LGAKRAVLFTDITCIVREETQNPRKHDGSIVPSFCFQMGDGGERIGDGMLIVNVVGVTVCLDGDS